MTISARASLPPMRAAAPARQRAAVIVRPAPGYRTPIDGLRAVAVGAVVLFHFGVAPFSGGFVGVDVFFVISGFLITRLLLADIADRKPLILPFYRRRILRLFPALFMMLAVTLAAALLLLYPSDLRHFGESLASVAGFGSNLYFRNSSGYFSAAADQKPLLHTWSLSVEEQFYLVYPPLLAVLARRSVRLAAAVLGLLALASLLASAWATRAAPMTAFYLTPFRFWELMLGGLIPLFGLAAPRSRAASETLAWGGLGLIAAAVFGYTLETPFPGLAALPPCLGAAAVILSCERPGSNAAARLLSLPAATALGRISYSLYLWHWPVIVFAGHWLFRRPTGIETPALIALSLALAAASYRFVEQPFRHGRGAGCAPAPPWPRARASWPRRRSAAERWSRPADGRRASPPRSAPSSTRAPRRRAARGGSTAASTGSTRRRRGAKPAPSARAPRPSRTSCCGAIRSPATWWRRSPKPPRRGASPAASSSSIPARPSTAWTPCGSAAAGPSTPRRSGASCPIRA